MNGVHSHFPKTGRTKGFSLLELLITLAVVVVLISAAAPSFDSIVETNKVKRLATEIEWLMVQAKSEAVMRGENVTVDIVGIAISSATGTDPDWQIQAKTSIGNEVIARVSGEQFPKISLYRTFTVSNVLFDSMTGRPNRNGSFVLSTGEKESVKVKASNMTGRLYVCSESGGYGYGSCPKS